MTSQQLGIVPSSLRLVAHHLTSIAPSQSHSVPTSHPAYQAPASSSSSRAQVDHHAHHAAARIHIEGDDEQSDLPLSAIVIARAVEEACALEVSIQSITPNGAASLVSPSDEASAATNPQIFLFPAPLLPNISIFVDSYAARLHILAVTITGWVFRLSFPLPVRLDDEANRPHDWATEHRIASIAGYEDATSASPSKRGSSSSTGVDLGAKTPTMVHAVEAGLLLVACRDGSLIKLEQARTDDGKYSGPWKESSLRSTSFLSNFSKFFSRSTPASPSVAAQDLPTSSSSSSSNHVVAMASHLRQDDSALGFCVSRDRKLRVWDLVTDNCLRTVDLPMGLLQDQADVGSSSSATLPPFGVEGASRPLVQMFSPSEDEYDDYQAYLLVYIPAPLPSGSFFAIYGIELQSSASSRAVAVRGANHAPSQAGLGEIALLWQKRCDENTRSLRAELRDASILCIDAEGQRRWTLWSLWDSGGHSTMVKHTAIQLNDDAASLDGDDETSMREGHSSLHEWHTIAYDPLNTYTPLRGPSFDSILSVAGNSPDSIAQIYLSRIFEASRYSFCTITWAIETYSENLAASLTAARLAFPLALEQPSISFASLAHRAAAIIGSGVRIETDPQTGALQHQQYRDDLIKEWQKFTGLLEESDSQGRWPISLVASDDPVLTAPLVLTSDRLLAMGGNLLSDEMQRLFASSSTGQASGTAAGHALAESIDEYQQQNTIQQGQRIVEVAELAVTLSRDALSASSIPLMVQEVDRLSSRPLEADLLSSALDLWETVIQIEDETVTESVSSQIQQLMDADNADQQSAFESALFGLYDILVDPATEQSQPCASLLSSSLSATFVSDGIYQTLRSRLALAESVAALVMMVHAEMGPEAFERLPELLVRILTILHGLSTLINLANRSSVPQCSPADDDPHQESEDRVTALLKGLSVKGAGGHVASARGFAAATSTSLLGVCIAEGLIPISDESQEDLEQTFRFPEALALGVSHGLRSLGLPSALGQEHQSSHELPGLPPQQALLAHRLLARGYPEAVLQLADAYPSDPTTSLLVARALLLLPSQQQGLAENNYEQAADAFEAVLPGVLTLHDKSAGQASPLHWLLPSVVCKQKTEAARLAAYYRHVADAFDRVAAAPAQLSHFTRLALQAVRTASISKQSSGIDVSAIRDLHSRLFRSELSLGHYDGCYAAIMDMDPTHDHLLRRDCLRTLVSAMCEFGFVAELFDFSFAGLQPEIERNLSFKARNSDPAVGNEGEPNYYHILYSYHMQRGDFTSAAASMYQQAQRLAEVQRGIAATTNDDLFLQLAVQQARSYLASINALSLLDGKEAWFAYAIQSSKETGALGGPTNTGRPPSGKLSRHIPSQHWQPDGKELQIIQQQDIQKEYHLVLARLELVQLYPELASSTMTLSGTDAVSLLVRSNQYEKAFTTARALGVDQTSIFVSLALKCAATDLIEKEKKRRRAAMLAQMDPDGTQGEVNALLESLAGDEEEDDGSRDFEEDLDDDDDGSASWSFLRTSERTSSWTGSRAALGWRYLQLNLDISCSSDKEVNKDGYRIAVLQRLLSLTPVGPTQEDGKIDLPAWLLQWFQTNRPDQLVRGYLEAGLLDDALRSALEWVRSSTKALSRVLDVTTLPSNSSKEVRPFIPTLLIDSLLAMAIDPDLRPSRGSSSALETRKLAEELKQEIVETRMGVLERKWRELENATRSRKNAGGEAMVWD